VGAAVHHRHRLPADGGRDLVCESPTDLLRLPEVLGVSLDAARVRVASLRTRHQQVAGVETLHPE